MSIADLFNKTWNIDSNLIFSFLSTPEEKRRIITSALQKIVLRFCNDQIRAEAIRLPPQPHQKPCQENLEIMISVPVIRRFENRDDAECVCVCVWADDEWDANSTDTIDHKLFSWQTRPAGTRRGSFRSRF